MQTCDYSHQAFPLAFESACWMLEQDSCVCKRLWLQPCRRAFLGKCCSKFGSSLMRWTCWWRDSKAKVRTCSKHACCILQCECVCVFLIFFLRGYPQHIAATLIDLVCFSGTCASAGMGQPHNEEVLQDSKQRMVGLVESYAGAQQETASKLWHSWKELHCQCLSW